MQFNMQFNINYRSNQLIHQALLGFNWKVELFFYTFLGEKNDKRKKNPDFFQVLLTKKELLVLNFCSTTARNVYLILTCLILNVIDLKNDS